MAKIGIIGGTGLENTQLLKDAKKEKITTPYGKPSSALTTGSIDHTEVVILSRHGEGHSITPTHVNNQANIWALKEAGCTHIIATTACGSLREEIGRGHIVFPDQFIDFTRHREITFHNDFKDGNLQHTPMADPFSNDIRKILTEEAKKLNLTYHSKGTLVTIEGPRFSTRAESNMFRTWGADLINMSTAPEVTLANEAGLPYAAIAISTDYDCWKTDEEPVTWEEVLRVFKQNVEHVLNLLIATIKKIGD